jgi:hypothetical protein
MAVKKPELGFGVAHVKKEGQHYIETEDGPEEVTPGVAAFINSIGKDDGSYEYRHETMVRYLRMKIAEGDWHGVSDAANDLRVLEIGRVY